MMDVTDLECRPVIAHESEIRLEMLQQDDFASETDRCYTADDAKGEVGHPDVQWERQAGLVLWRGRVAVWRSDRGIPLPES